MTRSVTAEATHGWPVRDTPVRIRLGKSPGYLLSRETAEGLIQDLEIALRESKLPKFGGLEDHGGRLDQIDDAIECLDRRIAKLEGR